MQTGTVSAFMSPSETELMNKLTFSHVLLACWTLREKQKHHLEKQGGQKMSFHFNFDLTLTSYCHVFGFGEKAKEIIQLKGKIQDKETTRHTQRSQEQN